MWRTQQSQYPRSSLQSNGLHSAKGSTFIIQSKDENVLRECLLPFVLNFRQLCSDTGIGDHIQVDATVRRAT